MLIVEIIVASYHNSECDGRRCQLLVACMLGLKGMLDAGESQSTWHSRCRPSAQFLEIFLGYKMLDITLADVKLAVLSQGD